MPFHIFAKKKKKKVVAIWDSFILFSNITDLKILCKKQPTKQQRGRGLMNEEDSPKFYITVPRYWFLMNSKTIFFYQ